MTNFEKIREMSKAEMSMFLKQFSDIDFGDYCENLSECDPTTGDPLIPRPCEKCIENWLNKEV